MTQLVTFQGKALYAQPGKLDTAYPKDGAGGNYSVKLIVNDENLKLFNALGAKAKAKRIDDLKKTEGLEDYLSSKYLTFRRYENVNYGKGWEPLGPVLISGIEEGQFIGNLSDLTVTAEAYPYTFEGKNGIAMRLVSVHVDNLIEYQKPVSIEASDNTPPVH